MLVEKQSDIRVRIAPGPTGPFHLGRSRTALVNWLYARHRGSTFVLRIEDTDLERSKPEHLQSILDSLRWLGLDWDEGPDVGGPYEPYFQMGRLETYRGYAERLQESGHAYRCYCTPEELNTLREAARTEKRPFRYPGICRNLMPEERRQREAEGRAWVTRLAVPGSGTTSFEDMILGEVSFDNAELDDFIIVKSNGIPTYNFAVVVDDTTMRITHVLRGQDHVSNTPRQLLIYRFLGEEPPHFAHLPLVVGLEEEKLSARHGAKAVSAWGAENGYLPDAVVNYLGTIGISYGFETEILTREELIDGFVLTAVSKSRAKADDDKLLWMNGVYIRDLPLERFVELSLPYLQMRGLIALPFTEGAGVRDGRSGPRAGAGEDAGGNTGCGRVLSARSRLVRSGAVGAEEVDSEEARQILEAALEIAETTPFDHDSLEERFRALADQLGMKTGVVFGTVRVAVTGRTAAPPLFATLVVLGRDRVIERLKAALNQKIE